MVDAKILAIRAISEDSTGTCRSCLNCSYLAAVLDVPAAVVVPLDGNTKPTSHVDDNDAVTRSGDAVELIRAEVGVEF